jgi:hypothetical protein
MTVGSNRAPDARERAKAAAGGPSLKERAREELRNYALVATYLYVSFAALMLFRNALLQEAGLSSLPLGFAAIKALILGKFILLGEAAGVGTRIGRGTLLKAIATKALLFFLLLVVLSVLEELLVGKVHGHSFAQTLAEYERHSVLELIATGLLLLLVLLPLIATQELNRVLGPGVLRHMLFDSGSPRAE